MGGRFGYIVLCGREPGWEMSVGVLEGTLIPTALILINAGTGIKVIRYGGSYMCQSARLAALGTWLYKFGVGAGATWNHI